jgi:hypothetical protein
LPLARPVLRQLTVDAVSCFVGSANVAADVGAIDFGFRPAVPDLPAAQFLSHCLTM